MTVETSQSTVSESLKAGRQSARMARGFRIHRTCSLSTWFGRSQLSLRFAHDVLLSASFLCEPHSCQQSVGLACSIQGFTEPPWKIDTYICAGTAGGQS